jgi:hypothetical protein
MLSNERMLLLRGWFEESRSLRVEVETPNLRILATCKIYRIEDEHIAFHISGHDYFEFSLSHCSMSFGDAKRSANEMPIGRTAESAVMAERDGFKAIIILLRD